MKTLSFLFLLLCSFAAAGEAPAPGSPGPQVAPMLSVTYEVFSIRQDEAAALQRKDPGDTEFYNALVAGLAKGGVKQECLMIARGNPEKKIKGQSVAEHIYPTEYEPVTVPEAQAPQAPVSGEFQASKTAGFSSGNPIPTTFETRNCGFTFEIEPDLSQDRQVVVLKLVSDHTAFAGKEKWGEGATAVEMPVFDNEQVTTTIVTPVGSPSLIGTVSKARTQEGAERRTWFAFVTVDIAGEK